MAAADSAGRLLFYINTHIAQTQPHPNPQQAKVAKVQANSFCHRANRKEIAARIQKPAPHTADSTGSTPPKVDTGRATQAAKNSQLHQGSRRRARNGFFFAGECFIPKSFLRILWKAFS